MSKGIILPYILVGIILISLIGVGGYFLGSQKDKLSLPVIGGPKACTQEAKLCPDGSSVGRTGLNCEFPPCPTGNKTPPITPKFIEKNNTNIVCAPCPPKTTISPTISPDFCPNGKIIIGEVDICGCPRLPRCEEKLKKF